MKIQGLYSGKSQLLQSSGEYTGIYKAPLGHVCVDELGIKGDEQVDKRYHGGPDKALHQYSLHGYRRLVDTYVQLRGVAVPGSIGENITVADMSEERVCIGDIYCFGSVVVQVSEPRRPCWKINAKFKQSGLTEFIEKEGITGWYYRVLEAGEMRLGDNVKLLERLNPQVNIAYFNEVLNMPRPRRGNLTPLIESVGLAAYLRARLEKKNAELDA